MHEGRFFVQAKVISLIVDNSYLGCLLSVSNSALTEKRIFVYRNCSVVPIDDELKGIARENRL